MSHAESFKDVKQTLIYLIINSFVHRKDEDLMETRPVRGTDYSPTAALLEEKYI